MVNECGKVSGKMQEVFEVYRKDKAKLEKGCYFIDMQMLDNALFGKLSQVLVQMDYELLEDGEKF